jgi:hypothetical protein
MRKLGSSRKSNEIQRRHWAVEALDSVQEGPTVRLPRTAGIPTLFRGNFADLCRSRSKEYKKRRRRSGDMGEDSRKYSDSSSVEFNHDKEYTEVKLVVPKKLANDHKELKYIGSLSRAEIRNLDQVR